MPVPAPLVSVCVPTYNNAPYVGAALESALAQTYAPLELLVVDNGSEDGTLELVRSHDDPRLRVAVNRDRVGLVANHNECVRLARGDWIKFLHADDVLRPESVERLMDVARRSDRVGLVFTRRSILLERPDDPEARAWAARYAEVHHRFGTLAPVNPGRELFDRWLAGLLRERNTENWIGEPTSVLVRRDAFARVGLFHTHLSQLSDVEMWLRIAFFYDVGFVDEELWSYRRHDESSSSHHASGGDSWLQRLWLIEGLLQHPEIRAAHPELRRARLAEAPYAVRRTAGRIARRRPFARLVREYLAYLARRRRPRLHEQLAGRR
jgi:glycosyltransferase involved in cell wall biosynthesis